MAHVRYIKILRWLWCFSVQIANFARLHCLAIPRRELSTKKTKPNIEKWPEIFGVMSCNIHVSNMGYCLESYTVSQRSGFESIPTNLNFQIFFSQQWKLRVQLRWSPLHLFFHSFIQICEIHVFIISKQSELQTRANQKLAKQPRNR